MLLFSHQVYANCIHRPNASFRSVGGLLMADGAAGMGGDVHVLYGLSKDLGVAGWRVGSGDAGFCARVRVFFLCWSLVCINPGYLVKHQNSIGSASAKTKC